MASKHEVEVTLTSAKELKNINWRNGANRPYAVVWVDSDRKSSTRVDEEGDASPHWNQTFVISLNHPIDDSTLFIDVVHATTGDEDIKPLIGSAKLSLQEILDEVGAGSRVTRSLKLRRPSGRPQGRVEVDVSIREVRYRTPQEQYYAPPYAVQEPPSLGQSRSGSYGYEAPPPPGLYTAPPASGYPYSAPPVAAGGYQYSAQPPPTSGYQYGAPPAVAQPASGYQYGAPPAVAQPASGYQYGAPPSGAQVASGYQSGAQQTAYAVPEEKKKSKLGMGAGLAIGALAGAVGGIALKGGFDKFEDHVADKAAERSMGVPYEDVEGYDDDGW